MIEAGICGKLTEQLLDDGNANVLVKQISEEKKQLIKEKKIKATKDVPPVAEDDILFVIPSNWSWVRFNDIANIVGTGMIRSGQEQYDEADYYYFKMNNIENFTGKCDFSNMTIENIGTVRTWVYIRMIFSLISEVQRYFMMNQDNHYCP